MSLSYSRRPATEEESETNKTEKEPITTAAVVIGNEPIRAKEINATAAKAREKNAGKRLRTSHITYFLEGEGWLRVWWFN